MAHPLEYVILGYVPGHDENDKAITLLAYSEGVPSQDSQHYRQLVALEPLPIPDEIGSQSVAIARYDEERLVLARAHFQQGNPDLPAYQYILLRQDVLAGIGGRIPPLLPLIEKPIPIYEEPMTVVEPLRMESSATLTLTKRVSQINQLVLNLLDEQIDLALTLLGAAIHERQVLIQNFPKEVQPRLEVVQGLRMMLPTLAGSRLSFTTYSRTIPNHNPMIVFSDADPTDTRRWVVNWNDPQVIPAVLEHPFIVALQEAWTGDTSEFIGAIKPMDILSYSFIQDDDLNENLARLTRRYQLDQQVRQGDDVSTQNLIDIIQSDAAPQGQLRQQYIETLLQNALRDRDTTAGTMVAQELDRDSQLDHALASVWNDMLETQPDAVYVFIRNRLNTVGVDKKWLSRLQAAATSSLKVAINEGDSQTLASWLELIAREPQSYELSATLREGILEAQPRARDDGDLGIRLILIAARRDPEILEKLYADDNLMDELPDTVGNALRENSTEALDALVDSEPQYVLLAVSHAIQMDNDSQISSNMVRRLWEFYQQNESINLPSQYQPLSLIQLIGTQYTDRLTDSAIDLLLLQVVEGDTDELFISIATHLANRDQLFPRLSYALQQSNRPFDELLNIVNRVATIANVSPDNVIQTQFDLLEYWDWAEITQPMMEQVTRGLVQHPDIVIPNRRLWRLFDAVSTLKLESPTRVAMQRLLDQISIEGGIEELSESMTRIQKQIVWSKSNIALLNTWWRTFTQTLTLVQLQRVDRELESKRALEAQRQIVQTAIAMRRLLGTRNLAEFAEAVSTAYSILESISDAFDTDGKQQLTEIDETTIRLELDSISDELPADARHILAKNLRELAQHIVLMSDKRSKSSIIRSDEAIDRQLAQGEASPQGSIDVMKWIAGYLGGTHADNEDE